MEWTDIRLTVSKADAEAAEAVATMIAEGGIYIEDYSDIEEQVEQIAHVDLIEQELLDKPRDTVIIHMYLEPGASPVETLALIAARMEAAGIPYTSETEGVEQEDWQNGWRKYYHPMDVGQRLAIVPSWQDYDTDRVKLILDPGLAFGTGGHETTNLCLEVLDERVKGGERVLDIGTGSGILAIAALKLGAAVAEGVDIDPVAVRTAGENAALNGVADKLTVLVGDLSDKASGRYDIITANIVANAIMSLAPAVPGLMADDAVFIASGIIDSRKDEVIAALEAAGLTDPIGTQLLHFYNDLLHLDFGTSRRIQNGASVVKVIGKKFGVSMRLGLISAGISLLVGIMLGILQTAFKDKVFDWIGTAYTVFVNAVPSLVSYSLVLVFGSKYLGFPTLYSTRNVGPSSVLPIVCLSLASIAGYALWTRRYMVDELTRDYIKLARVKGLSSSEIMFKHVLRNAMVPMVQYIPQSILLTVGGSLLMERFFSVPGMGPLLTDAIQRYDLNVVQTLVILYAALGIVGVFLGDVLMMLVDPRITLTGKEAAR